MLERVRSPDPQPAPAGKPADAGRSFVLPARLVLPLVLAVLVALVVTPIAGLGLWAVTDNTGRLLRDYKEAMLDRLVSRLHDNLDQVKRQMDLAATAVATGKVDPADDKPFAGFVFGVMSATPQVTGIGLLTAEGPFRRWERESLTEILEPRSSAPLADEIIARARRGEGAWWSPPFVSLIRRRPTMLYFQPLRREGSLIGVFMVAIASESVADELTDMAGKHELEPFILAGPDRVVVHRNLRNADPSRAEVPRLDEVGDPVLARMWDNPRALPVTFPLMRSQGHYIVHDGSADVFFYRRLAKFGDTPWIIGFHEPSDSTFRERAFVAAMMFGTPVLILLSLGLAWWIGHLLARRLVALAERAAALEALDFSTAPADAADCARVREIRDTMAMLDRTAIALGRFAPYVPRGLVRQLLTLGPGAAEPKARHVSILFLDLDGYSRFAEGRLASEVSTALNKVFARIGPIIEKHDGMLDKFTGDGVLAVWGAPIPDAHHAARALAAAREIAKVMTKPIIDARKEDPRACRIRIGLHSGEVIAGNLGYTGRTDYTVIGRPVNVAQRVQAALKPHLGDAAVIIGATATLIAAAGLSNRDHLALGAGEPLTHVGEEAVFRIDAGQVPAGNEAVPLAGKAEA